MGAIALCLSPPAVAKEKTVEQQLEFVSGQTDAWSKYHQKAAKICDLEGMKKAERNLKGYADDARTLAKRLKGAGEFAVGNADLARQIADRAARNYAAAKARPPENCPKEAQIENAINVNQQDSTQDTPEQQIARLIWTASQLDTLHRSAAKECNIALMQATLAQLTAIDSQLGKVRQQLDFDFDIGAPRDAALRVTIKVDDAQLRLPENCPKTNQLQQQLPSEPEQQQQQVDEVGSVILKEHNKLRANFGSPALQWDPALAQGAFAYAQQLARTGQRVHAPREGLGIVRENLSEGRVSWGPIQMSGNWVKEQRYFRPGAYPDVSTTGSWEDVSHFTQIIWPATISLGCGMADGSGHRWLVCRYSPGGNKDGKLVGVPAQSIPADPKRPN
ncbi:MAG: CAP domain-containing protein [Sphingomicrobium sp.]